MPCRMRTCHTIGRRKGLCHFVGRKKFPRNIRQPSYIYFCRNCVWKALTRGPGRLPNPPRLTIPPSESSSEARSVQTAFEPLFLNGRCDHIATADCRLFFARNFFASRVPVYCTKTSPAFWQSGENSIIGMTSREILYYSAFTLMQYGTCASALKARSSTFATLNPNFNPYVDPNPEGTPDPNPTFRALKKRQCLLLH